MVRYLRIGGVLLLTAIALAGFEEAVGIGGEGLTLTVDGLIHLCLGLVVFFVTAFTDREFFGLD